MQPNPEVPARDLRRLYRYTLWSMAGSGPMALLATVSVSANWSHGGSWVDVEAVLLMATTAVATLMLVRYVMGRYEPVWWLWWPVVAVFACGVVLSAATSSIIVAWAGPGGLLAAVPALWARPGRRSRVVLGAAVLPAVAGLVLVPLGAIEAPVVVLHVVLVPLIALMVVSQWWIYHVALALEHARGLAAELAVAEERLRFAAELHDIQGGHLQAIVLKAQLARRLVATRPDESTAQLASIEDLSRTALRDTRAVVGGYRRVSLVDEVDSAARILGSAGVSVTVDAAAADLDDERQRLLGLLVREGTTNLLRHADATRAWLRVASGPEAASVTIANDGAHPGDAGEDHTAGNGLTMLAERFAAAGGTVAHTRETGRFTLTGTLPRRPGTGEAQE